MTLRSHLAFHPGAVEWVALVRYQVSGGSSRAIRLDLPADWAEVVDVRLARGQAEVRREPNGPRAILTITPGIADLGFRRALAPRSTAVEFGRLELPRPDPARLRPG